MVVHISGSQNATYTNFATAGETYILDTFAKITASNAHGVAISAATDITFRVEGIVASSGQSYFGVVEYDTSTSTRVEIAATGIVRGQVGLHLNGNLADVLNEGHVQGGFTGVYISSPGGGTFVNKGDVFADAGTAVWIIGTQPTFAIRNEGSISGTAGIDVSAVSSTIQLSKSSIVSALSDYAIYDGALDGGSMTLTNAGYIRSANYAYYSANSVADTVTNFGRMVGNVALRAGEDMFSMKGGRVDGTVSGGAGDDTFVIKKGKVVIDEIIGQGDDTLRSAVSYKLGDAVEIENIILIGRKNINFTGSITDNDIRGNSGSNRLEGGAGTDVLEGGKGRDIFVFAKFTGIDTITDFQQGEDRIEVRSVVGVKKFADLDFAQDGKDVVIDSGMGEILIIENAKVKDFDKGDFLFVG
ncbi:hypothetical protein [Rhizobium sp.]